MKVRYSGPSAEVTLPAYGVTVKRGGTVDLPDDAVLGDNWQPVESKPAPKSTHKAAKAAPKES